MAEISLVIPTFNGGRYVEELYSGLTELIKDINKDCEIVFINDGSTDDTFKVLSAISKNDKRVKFINFSNNLGQYAALSAGINASEGDIIITLDDDFKNFQADIARLLEQIRAGHDIIFTWRIDRRESFFWRIVPSYMINIFISIFIGRRVHDVGCSLKAFTGKVAEDMQNYNRVIQFIPQLRKYRIKEMRANVLSTGKTRYGIFQLIWNALLIIFICINRCKSKR